MCEAWTRRRRRRAESRKERRAGMLSKSEVRIPRSAERTDVSVNGKPAAIQKRNRGGDFLLIARGAALRAIRFWQQLKNAVQKILTLVHHVGNALGQGWFRANYGGMQGIQ